MLEAAVRGLRRGVVGVVRRYHRLEVIVDEPLPDQPALLVANHGFGGIVDLNVFAIYGALDEAGVDRPVTPLVHRLAWLTGVGPIVEAAGGRPASRESALTAFAEGNHVLVLPGGDLDAGKSWSKRNYIVFGGRRGFAKLAMEAGVPIVPVVTAGAGESLLVLSDGQSLAKTFRADRFLRTKALPVSVSVPWGLNVGVVGILPYLPLPTKLVTRILPAMWPAQGASAAEYADAVQHRMQQALTGMTKNRKLLRG